ncbi:MAG: YtxH domain-containing protein, partial [Actinomycetota bacterium]
MKKSGILSNLLLVFGLGVLIGILFAPRSGEKTRKMLAEKMEDTCGSTCTNLIDRVAMLKGRINEYM